MIRVGIVGLGFMGMIHYRTYQQLSGVEVVAIADRHPERLAGDWTAIKGNFGPPGEQMNLAGVATYLSPHELIEDESIDLVDICLPPAAHTKTAVAALSAGKHVFCEKPLALRLEDCDLTIKAAAKADRQLLVGHTLPYFPEYAWALRNIRSGQHGRVLAASFKRVISDPSWLPRFWDAKKIGGPMFDLHVHDAHFIRLAFGMPKDVVTRGTLRGELPERWHTLFDYGNQRPVVHATSGVLSQAGRPFVHGFDIQMEEATLVFEFSVDQTVDGERASYTHQPTLYNQQGIAETANLGDGDPMQAFKAELRHVIDILTTGSSPDALSVGVAKDAIALCNAQVSNLMKN